MEEIRLTQQTTNEALAYFANAANPPTKWRVVGYRRMDRVWSMEVLADTRREAIGKAKLTAAQRGLPSPTVCDVEQLGVVLIQR